MDRKRRKIVTHPNPVHHLLGRAAGFYRRHGLPFGGKGQGPYRRGAGNPQEATCTGNSMAATLRQDGQLRRPARVVPPQDEAAATTFPIPLHAGQIKARHRDSASVGPSPVPRLVDRATQCHSGQTLSSPCTSDGHHDGRVPHGVGERHGTTRSSPVYGSAGSCNSTSTSSRRRPSCVRSDTGPYTWPITSSQSGQTTRQRWPTSIAKAARGRLLSFAGPGTVLCDSLRITLRASHLAGKDNVVADALSRGNFDSGGWSLSQTWANHVFDLYGRPVVDMFASATQRSPTNILLQIPRTTGVADRRSFLSMDGSLHVRFPAIRADPQGVGVTQGRGGRSPHRSVLAQLALVSSSDRVVSGPTIHVPDSERDPYPTERTPEAPRLPQPPPSCVDAVRLSLEAAGFPPEAAPFAAAAAGRPQLTLTIPDSGDIIPGRGPTLLIPWLCQSTT